MNAERARMLSAGAHEAAGRSRLHAVEAHDDDALQLLEGEDIPGYAEAAREYDFHAHMERHAALPRRRADAAVAARAAAPVRPLAAVSDAAESDPTDMPEPALPTELEAEQRAHDAPRLECDCRRVTCTVCNDDPRVDRMPKEARANHQRAAAGAAERRQHAFVASLDGAPGRE